MAKARVAVLISGTGTNMAALLYAAKELLAEIPHLELMFVGQGAQRQGLEQAAELLGLPFMVKPVAEAQSRGAHVIASEAELRRQLEQFIRDQA